MRSLLVGLALLAAPAPIDSYVTTAVEDTGLPGVSVVVTEGDRIVEATGAGHDSTGRQVDANTPMRVASVSKSFTAYAVLTLVENGQLALDDPVAARLPEFRLADARARKVTVRQLLNQTSGLKDTTVDIPKLETATTLAAQIPMLDSATLATDPGTEWAYCNVNYDVAARLVEVVSGQRFDEYLRTKVFEPLGMRNTSVGGWAANGYNTLFGTWFARPEPAGGPRVNGAGAVVTTARDMGRWLIAQTGHGPIPAETLRELHTPPQGRHYAMGWSRDDESGLLTHSGNLFTYNAIEAIDPATGYGYAVLSNGAPLYDDTGDILNGLVALSHGETPPEVGGDRQTFEWGLALLGLLAVGLAVLGAVRARRWAHRRRTGRTLWTVVRLAVLLLPAVLFLLYPQAISFISAGRTVLWVQLFYFPLPLTITLAAAATAGLVVFGFRLVRLRSAT